MSSVSSKRVLVYACVAAALSVGAVFLFGLPLAARLLSARPAPRRNADRTAPGPEPGPHAGRRAPPDLSQYEKETHSFGAMPIDESYALAWATTFHAMRRRHSGFIRYLRAVETGSGPANPQEHEKLSAECFGASFESFTRETLDYMRRF
ncbi:MAG: hypothetical protein JXR37_15205 [Kiritimatiellae bacterium]|nr:hypothetical protein [Kiritimatiellia bacterium]